MPAFSKILSDDEILSLVTQSYQRILIIGCSWCINESLAYTTGQSIFKCENTSSVIEDGRFAFSSRQELLRLKELLSKTCQHILLLGPMELEGKAICALDKTDVEKIATIIQATRIDKILVLSCASGAMSLRNAFSVPVEEITTTCGYLSYAYIDDKSERKIDYEHSKVIKIKEYY